ncbi:leucine-rich repeat protein [Ruminococcus sp.]|uniref:leucine-rich repeat protein n=1 Tax=Ruminococcus sp. TaxID=41978 RepID=UPI0025F34EBB|nr:leucine-rich repeat protein [Ruminococcus sp.]MCR4639392.1 leucine-rich repeat protein [Ruminococcus sp.]
MKKIISTLAALSILCGSVCTAAPVFAESVLTPTQSAVTSEYDLDEGHKIVKEDDFEYLVYDKFVLITRVNKEDIEEFTVPETYKDKPVVGLTDGPFRDCKNLKKINLSKNIAVFDWIFIAEEGIEEITVPEDSKYFTAVDGVIYTKDMTELVACPNAGGKTELTIPDETVSIDRGALACCRDLKKVTMGENLEKIYPSAFWGCSGLTEVNFSQKLKAIGYFAFAGCSSLESVDLPDSLEEMYEDVFKDTACIKTENSIKYVDGWAVGTDKEITAGDIREGTVGTASGIFSERYQLKYIVVPSSVKHITDRLIIGLGQYMDIDFIAFYNNNIPAGCLATNGIKGIEIYDPNCKITDSPTTLPAYHVYRDESYVPSSNEEKPTEYTLSHKTVTVSSSSGASSSIQRAINTELIDLDTISLASNENAVKKAPIKAGASPKYDTVIHGAKGSTAEDYAIKYRRVFMPLKLKIEENEPLTKINKDGATYDIYSKYLATASVRPSSSDTIKEITISSEAESPEVGIAPVRTLFVIGANADKISIPATIEQYIHLEDSPDDKVAFYDVDKDNPYLTSVDGIIYSKDMTKLIKVPSRYAGKKIVVPDGVKIIDSFALYGLENVESIELPDSVETIGKNSFANSSKLKSVKLSEKLDVIGDYAFAGCTGIKDISIPESVNHIGYNAFLDVPAVKSEDGLDYLGSWCVGVTEVEPEKSKPANIKEGTVGIAKLDAAGYILVPKSVTKMSWEMLSTANRVVTAYVDSHVIDFDAFKNAKYMKNIFIYDPECEICAGYRTIPAQHIDVGDDSVKSHQERKEPLKSYFYRTPLMEELEADSDEEICDTVIHGFKGSTAEAYAKMYGIKFEKIEQSGDLNVDGEFNVADLVMMSRFINGMTTLDERQIASADLNGDGNIDIFDMVEFRKKILESMRDN